MVRIRGLRADRGRHRRVCYQEPPEPFPELFSKHPVLFAKVFDHLKLALIHPSGNSDQQEPEWIQDYRHLVAALSLVSKIRARSVDSTGADFRIIGDRTEAHQEPGGTLTVCELVRRARVDAIFDRNRRATQF